MWMEQNKGTVTFQSQNAVEFLNPFWFKKNKNKIAWPKTTFSADGGTKWQFLTLMAPGFSSYHLLKPGFMESQFITSLQHK